MAIHQVTPKDAAALLAGHNPPRLVDVREEDEHAICHVHGAELIPLSRWVEEAVKRFGDPDEPVLLYCHRGVRSMKAARWLDERGYARVMNLEGGIDAWATEIAPDMARYQPG